MKKQHLFGLLVLSVVMSVAAATPALDERYIILVGVDAPAADVVTGANFAASVSSLATFTSATTEQARAEIDLDDKYLVVIDGKNVLLLGQDEYGYAFENYFLDEGFSVEKIYHPSLSDLGVVQLPEVDDEVIVEATNPEPEHVADALQGQAKEQLAKPVEEFVCPGCVLDDTCYVVGDVLDVDGTDHECTAAGLEPVEEPGIITRIVNWFRNLF